MLLQTLAGLDGWVVNPFHASYAAEAALRFSGVLSHCIQSLYRTDILIRQIFLYDNNEVRVPQEMWLNVTSGPLNGIGFGYLWIREQLR